MEPTITPPILSVREPVREQVRIAEEGTELSAVDAVGPGVSVASESHLTNTEVALLFDRPLPALTSRASVPSITGNRDTDARITEIGFSRGYLLRGDPVDGLGLYQGRRLQQVAIDDLVELQAAMFADIGATLTVTSAYRSVALQRRTFLSRLQGLSDAAIDKAMQIAAPPGFSRHHTGFAIDDSSAGLSQFEFTNSAAWRWLIANSYENAMRFGWIPSYPDHAAAQGPIPEPWEWVWIGRDAAACARARACAIGSLDAASPGQGSVTGWASTQQGDPVRRIRIVTRRSNERLEPTLVSRLDVALAFGFDVASLGIVANANLTQSDRWVCLEARTVKRGPWSRVGCLELTV